MEILEFSEDTITVYVNEASLEKNNRKLVYILYKMKSINLHGIIDSAISYNSLVIHYTPRLIDSIHIRKVLSNAEKSYSLNTSNTKRIVEIPVCYDAHFGLDHDKFYDRGLSKEDIISMHTEKEYLIYMIGFLPGFPFLNGVHEKLRIERLASPRVAIPKGSVGIAGEQTGIYPSASPGGWNIIGRTPLNLEIKNDNLDIPYGVGDYIKFVPISRDEFDEIEKLEFNNQYDCVSYERGV